MKQPLLKLKILETLNLTAQTSVDLLEAFLVSGYAPAYRIRRNLAKIQERRLRNNIDEKNKQRFYSFISKLKADGLITEQKQNAQKIFALSTRGQAYLNKHKNPSPLIRPFAYTAQEHLAWVIITFDIPERQRKKRDWLRKALVSMNFRMLQRSVWMGKKKLPENFLNDLHLLKINTFIEIFEISKGGTLKHVL